MISMKVNLKNINQKSLSIEFKYIRLIRYSCFYGYAAFSIAQYASWNSFKNNIENYFNFVI